MSNGTGNIIAGVGFLALAGGWLIYTGGDSAMLIAPIIGAFLLWKGIMQRKAYKENAQEGSNADGNTE